MNEQYKSLPGWTYTSDSFFELEKKELFLNNWQLICHVSNIPNAGDYFTFEIFDERIFIIRADDQKVRAFHNVCSHRATKLLDEVSGSCKDKVTCPYHAWSYNREGELIGILSNKDFGDIDKSCYGLTELPCLERAGLIWVTTDPKSTLDISTFLSGYDELLAHFGFESWHHFDSQIVPGPNWKIAYDGYMDLYHLPILHKDTFGADFPNKALYYKWGPHQRVSGPDATLSAYEDLPEAEWPTEHLISGVWTIFPHVSIAGFDGGGRAVMISQLFPGDTPETSFTIQNYVMEKAPNEEEAAAAREQFKFLRYVVEEEDYATGIKQQHALRTGAKDHILFGRNEGGGHDFHQWVDTLLETADEDLEKLFTTG